MSHHQKSTHHIVPKSRGGKKTVNLPKSFHQAWHTCFSNLTPEEIVIFVKRVQKKMKEEDAITSNQLHDLRKHIKASG